MSSLKSQSISGTLWSLAGSFSSQGISFLISIVLARLLTPEDFGLVGLSMVFISITQVFADFGFSSALIQNKDNSSVTYSSIFYLNILIGAGLFGLFQILAPYIAVFYAREETTLLIRLLSISFILASLNIVQQTILRRNIDFKKLTTRKLFGQFVGGILGIWSALKGLGVYSLIIQMLSAQMVETIILWRITDWYPRLEYSFAEVKKLFSFGSYYFFDRLSATLSERAEVLFIGKVFSPSTLGFYSRAESTSNLVTAYSSRSITSVFFPILSKIQDDEERFKRVYFKIVSVVSFISFLLTGVLYLMGPEIILGLFGPQWEESVWIFQILILKSFTFPFNSVMIITLLAKGKSKENFQTGFIRRIIRLTPILFGLLYGFNVFIWSIVFVSYFLTIYNVVFINRYLKYSVYEHLKKILECILPLILLFIFYQSIEPINLIIKVFILLVFLMIYFLYARMIRMEGYIFLLSIIKDGLKNIKN